MELIRAVAFLIAAASALAAALSVGGAASDRLDVFAQLTPFWLTGGLLAVTLQFLAGGEGRLTFVAGAAATVICVGLMGARVYRQNDGENERPRCKRSQAHSVQSMGP